MLISPKTIPNSAMFCILVIQGIIGNTHSSTSSSKYEMKTVQPSSISFNDITETLYPTVSISGNEDFKRCKSTRMGLEYIGSLSHTIDNKVCQQWDMKGRNTFKLPDDYIIPQGLNASKAFCRNPDNDFNGPWCPQFAISSLQYSNYLTIVYSYQ